MNATTTINFGLNGNYIETPTESLIDLFQGKSITSASLEDGTLTLSDGTVLTIVPNYGEGWDGAGDFFLDRVATVENVTINVDALIEYDSSRESGRREIYKINVYTAGIPTAQEIVSVSGDMENGYYGSGFVVIVTR